MMLQKSMISLAHLGSQYLVYHRVEQEEQKSNFTVRLSSTVMFHRKV